MLSLVVAMAENRVIGRGNALPWRLPGDLKRFRRLTMGHPVIMGRKTYESIGKPLPGRTNIVVTRTPGYSAPGCTVVGSLEAALKAADGAPHQPPEHRETFVIGGAELYAQALPLARRIHLTLVHAELEGDAFFPEFDLGEWRELSRECHEADGQHPYAYSFVTLERF
ncbi:dihydrofolate reductase [Calidithermus timidus]|uniref:dihydrofolate reductase n=1 Tax=Calidithermus timidus TaxID=307124 RepID=UPI00037D6F4B|nr:dihydrofolate reductase [Calidithermus timidus]